MRSESEQRARELLTRIESKLMRGMDHSAPNVMVPIDDLRDLLQMAEKSRSPHPLDCLHINQGSMDAAADAYEEEYRAAHAALASQGEQQVAGDAEADADEDAYVIDRLAHLLAEVAVIVNGPEPAGTRWSYHDLPDKVRAIAARQPVCATCKDEGLIGGPGFYSPDEGGVPCPDCPVRQPVKLSPEFTDTARAAIAWVLWHHQGASSAIGQPLRFALGMGAHDELGEARIAEAKRYAAWAGATTADFHRPPAQPQAPAAAEEDDDEAPEPTALDIAFAKGYADGIKDGQRTAPAAEVPEWMRPVLAELELATRKFPTWPTDPLHALGVFGEEYGELNKAVLQCTYEPNKSGLDEVRTEATQAAAMALRFLMSLDSYVYAGCVQHQQEALAAAPAPGWSDEHGLRA